ncbi:hypothetical protein ColKHC_03072 [Colletotrichum higginsianum]|nr:hypothetical protein ColKHC_03072 [Colletotrichum higginsianum]
MATNGNKGKTLLSLLCGDEWAWDQGRVYSLKFHENGTGEITACQEMVIFIAAEFDWESSGTTPTLAQPFEPDHDNGTEFDVQITLTKRRMAKIPDRYKINEENLEESAFQPKKYRLRLEQGMFMPKEPPAWHRLRLAFNPSPYPTLDHWKCKQAAEAIRFWEMDTFHSQKVPSRDESDGATATKGSGDGPSPCKFM